MHGLLFAELAELLKLQALLGILLVLLGLVVQVMANRAFHVDQIVLGHFRFKIKDLRLMLSILLGVRRICGIIFDPKDDTGAGCRT